MPVAWGRGEGGGGVSYDGLYEEVTPKGIPFSGFVGYERVWISLVEVYQGVEKNWHFVLHSKAVNKSRKSAGFVICSYLIDNKFTAVERHVKV